MNTKNNRISKITFRVIDENSFQPLEVEKKVTSQAGVVDQEKSRKCYQDFLELKSYTIHLSHQKSAFYFFEVKKQNTIRKIIFSAILLRKITLIVDFILRCLEFPFAFLLIEGGLPHR